MSKALPTKGLFCLTKKKNTIQYGYRKGGKHSQMRTARIKVRQRNIRRQEERSKYGKKQSRPKKSDPDSRMTLMSTVPSKAAMPCTVDELCN